MKKRKDRQTDRQTDRQNDQKHKHFSTLLESVKKQQFNRLQYFEGVAYRCGVLKGVVIDRNSTNKHFMKTYVYFEAIDEPLNWCFSFPQLLSAESFSRSSIEQEPSL